AARHGGRRRGGRGLDAAGDRSRRLRGPAALPEWRGRATNDPLGARAARPIAGDRALARARSGRRTALRAASDRPRPAPPRRPGPGRAGAASAAPAAARTTVRAGAARGAGSGPGDPRAGAGPGPVGRAMMVRMSHLDELDEFEAELELALKKEYSAVFALFRYCVLTQDATYLCNKLDLQYVPQPSYPFFQLKMEDVWVWDKNRPTRIIPRAEVYTSSDVTV